MQKSKNFFRLMCLTLTAVMLCSLTGCFSYGGYDYYDDSYNNYNDTISGDDENLVIEYDAESYFQNNSTIVSTINVEDSDDLNTGASTYLDMTARGFEGCIITSDYDLHGNSNENSIISFSSTDYYPAYTTTFYSTDGSTWTIHEINGVIMAYPVSHNLESDLDTPVVITETDTIMSYDNIENVFYETIPFESSMIVKKVDRIDADTLNSLTKGAIDAL